MCIKKNVKNLLTIKNVKNLLTTKNAKRKMQYYFIVKIQEYNKSVYKY